MFIFEHNARNKRYCDHCNHIRRKEIWNRNNAITKQKRGEPDPNKIQCLICHKYYKKPMSHAWQAHGTTAREYKDNYNLEQRGLIPEHAREILREHVKNNYDLVVKHNLLNNPKSQKHRFKKDHNFNYIRKPATLERLKQHAKTTLQNNHSKK